MVLTQSSLKDYTTVDQRIDSFRKEKPMWTIKNHIHLIDDTQVIIESQILDETGRLIANGFAHEYIAKSMQTNRYGKEFEPVNMYSFLENCETSATGRALRMAGFGESSPVASRDDMAQVLHRQEARQQKNTKKPQASAPEKKAREAMIKKEEMIKEIPELAGENIKNILKYYKVDHLDDLDDKTVNYIYTRLTNNSK